MTKVARERVKIYLKGGAVIEFEAEGFWVDGGGEKTESAKIRMLHMEGDADLDLTYIDLAEVAAITQQPVPSRGEQSV
jgi:hypothetical protein